MTVTYLLHSLAKNAAITPPPGFSVIVSIKLIENHRGHCLQIVWS